MQIPIYLEKKEYNGKNLEVVPIGDIEVVISTNEPHRQHGKVGNKRSTRSQSTSQRSGTPNKTLNL
jgi:hypothetical protein